MSTDKDREAAARARALAAAEKMGLKLARNHLAQLDTLIEGARDAMRTLVRQQRDAGIPIPVPEDEFTQARDALWAGYLGTIVGRMATQVGAAATRVALQQLLLETEKEVQNRAH